MRIPLQSNRLYQLHQVTQKIILTVYFECLSVCADCRRILRENYEIENILSPKRFES